MPRLLPLLLLLPYLLVHGGAGDWSVRAEAGGLCCIDTAACCCAPEAQVEAKGSCLMAAPCGAGESLHLSLNERVPHQAAAGIDPQSAPPGRLSPRAATRSAYSLPASTPDPVPITPVFS